MREIEGAMINRYIVKRQAEVTIIPARTVKGSIAIPERDHQSRAGVLKHMFRLAVDAASS
jgi:hypothetical protein